MKKKENKKNLATEFPNIFRFIPEELHLKKLLKKKETCYFLSGASAILSLVLICALMVSSVSLYNNLSSFSRLTNSRQQIKGDINFWQSILEKYDGYKDAYFQRALLEYKLGEYAQAKQDNSKALLLDPNFTDAQNLQKLLAGN